MQLKSFLVALVAAVGVFGQTTTPADPSINTPTGVTECLPVQLTFSGTQGPWIITVQPAGQAGAAPLTTVGTAPAGTTAITWNVNLPAGTAGTLVIRDGLGRTNPSAPFTVLANPTGNVSCLGTNTVAPASSVPASSAPASSAPASSAAGSTPASVPASTPVTTPAGASSAPAASAQTTSTRNSASSIQPLSLAGLLGIVGVAALL
ncbi:hypothetical protein FRB99_001613 [Tulasnella sp. 403]|nr:hypothetical protein FRB99_001613 [Tulasnella sp. 403]